MPSSLSLPIFDHYPQLKQKLSPVKFAELPTPVKQLSGISEHAWVKCDDVTHREYGGNKIRKLDFVLADILQQGKKHIYTFGAIGTNAGVATAMMCQKNNLKCTVFLFDQPDSETVQKNYKTMQDYGAELIYCGSLLRTVLRYYLSLARFKKESYFLWAGCSNPVATFAYVNAAFELKQQIDQGLLPEPKFIYLPVGSASTIAGLTLGVQLAGLNSVVIGVRVAQQKLGPFDACSEAMADDFINYAAKELGLSGSNIAKSKFDHSYFGSGYGEPTDKSQNAVNILAKQGVKVENTYSAKAAAAFLDELAQTSQPVLFWNTFNSHL